MNSESFKPISVKSPQDNLFLFKIRCLVDLQLKTIADFLKPEISNLPQGSIIDVGAGESPWKGWLSKKSTYHGIDVAHSNEFGMSQKNSEVILYDGTIMPLESNSFDGAICAEVLEHAKDPEMLLAEISRILKPGATLLLTIPWSARIHHIPHDYQRFTKEKLKILLSKQNFKNISIKERGNDYCVVANKLIVILIRNATSLKISNFLYKIPLIATALIFLSIMLSVAHISLMFESKQNEDPLGYACKAIKSGK